MIALKRHWPWIILAFLILAYTTIFSALSILRYSAFASGFDLGNMDQTVWNTLQGRVFSLTTNYITTSRFAVHGDIILAFLAPLYIIWDSPKVLLVLQSFYLALGIIPIFLIARHIFKDNIVAILFAILYLLNPLIEWTNFFDFHAVTMSIPLLLTAFYAMLKERWRVYGISLFIALLTKEEVSLQIAILGLITAFVYKKKRVGLITFGAGVMWFVVMVFGIIPFFSPSGKHWALNLYQFNSSDNNTSSFQNVFAKVTSTFTRLVNNAEIKTYYVLLLKSFGFLPILGLPWLLLTAPDLLINVLSSHAEMHSIKYHYTSGLIPGLMIASIYGMNYVNVIIQRIALLHKHHISFVRTVLIIALIIVGRVNYHYSPLPTTDSCWCDVYQVSKEDKEFESILRKIPVDASVTASYEIHAHVTHRENSYVLPYAVTTADYIAVIDQNRDVGNYLPKVYENQLITTLNNTNGYELVNQVGHFYLFKKTSQ